MVLFLQIWKLLMEIEKFETFFDLHFGEHLYLKLFERCTFEHIYVVDCR